MLAMSTMLVAGNGIALAHYCRRYAAAKADLGRVLTREVTVTLCPYCDQFQPTTRCPVPGCGGFVCPCSGRCNRAEHWDPAAHAAADAVRLPAGRRPE